MTNNITDARVLDVGVAIRELRQRHRMTLKQLADEAGLSESFLSQVERSRANASVASLQKLAAALGTSLAELFAHEQRGDRVELLRRSQRFGISYGIFGRKFLLTPQPLETVEVFAAEFEVGGSTGDQAYGHDGGTEFITVLTGTFELHVGDTMMTLEVGDSISYQSSVPHRLINTASGVSEAIWVSPLDSGRAAHR